MTNKATKYGLMTIAAVLLVALAFAGAASAGTIEINSNDWNRLDTISFETEYHFNNSGNELIYPKYLGNNQISLTGDLTLNFSDYTGGFSGNETIGNDVGALFGNISIQSGKTLEIVGLNMTDVDVITSGVHIGGIVGYIDGSGVLNFTNSHLISCNIKDKDMGEKEDIDGVAGLLGKGNLTNVNVDNCSVVNCEFLSINNNVGGLIGRANSVSFVDCIVKDSVVESLRYNVGGLIGRADSTVNYVRDCNVNNCVIKIQPTFYYVGGLIGRAMNSVNNVNGCIISNCTLFGSQCVGGIVGRAETTVNNVISCDVKSCVITSDNQQLGGLFGQVAGSISSVRDCNVINCIITLDSDKYYAGGLVGYAKDKITGVSNCDVTNCIISARTADSHYIGGLVGYVTKTVDNVTDCDVTNCTIAGNRNVGGLFGQIVKTTADCDVNAVNNCSVCGSTTSTRLDCGNGKDIGCVVTENNFIRNKSIGEPQPLIVTKLGVDSVSHSKAIVTRLSGVGVLNNSQNAVGYVIDDALLEFNPTNGSSMSYFGCVNISDTKINFETPIRSGYTFAGWNLTSASGMNLTNAEGVLLSGVPGYTNASGNWNNATETLVELYANWTINTTNVVASDNKASFGNNNVTAIHSESGVVVKVLLDEVSNVTNTAVNFTADNTTVQIPDITGYLKDEITIFDLNATADGTAKINVTVTFANESTATAKKDNVSFFHYVGSVCEPLNSTIVDEDNANVIYTVETTSFCPFGIGIYTPITYTIHFDANGGQGSMEDMAFTYDVGQNLTANAFQRYNSNFLYWTYNGTKYYNTEFVKNLTTESETVVMKAQWETYSTGGSSSGTTYMGSNSASYTPTQQPTVAPTVAPTVKPTEQPATPTVIATEKPTTQATQQSPAPFVGLLAGLGATAVLLRLRK